MRLPKPIPYDWSYVEKRYGASLPVEKRRGITFCRAALTVYMTEGCHSILDFGCGAGDFVKAMSLVDGGKWEALGYDIVDYQGEYKRLVTNCFDRVAQTSWDVVSCFDSLEHLNSFGALFNLGPKYFIISLPNLDESLLSVEKFVAWRHYRPYEHLVYFTKAALCNFFASNGYALVWLGHPEDIYRVNHDIDFPNITSAVFKRI